MDNAILSRNWNCENMKYPIENYDVLNCNINSLSIVFTFEHYE